MTIDTLRSLLEKDRSVRRFDESRPIKNEQLLSLVELCRYCASGRNLQPLKYLPINDKKTCNEIFPLLKWAGYLKDWEGPKVGERPVAYLVQCLDTRITSNPLCDDGLQLQAITLGTTSLGIGACIIKSFNLEKLKQVCKLPQWAEPYYVLALGYPVETVVIDDINSDNPDAIKYYRDKDEVHHVPKRTLDDLLI